MGEKKKNGEKGKKGDEGKKEKTPLTVVLKVDLHCEGCATKIVKHVRGVEGVESVKTEISSNKVTVIGDVDPSVIREKLQQKIKKKVDLISPQAKKEDNKEKKENKPEKEKNLDANKKPKEPPVTTAVLKLRLHCQGCIEKIQKTVSKTKGVHDMSLDKPKELVTVKGTMDIKALTEALKEKLKRPVEVVPPKKEKEKEKEKEEGGNGGGGGKKKNGGNGGGGDGGKEEGNKGSKMEYTGVPGMGYGYEQPMFMMPGYVPPGYAPTYMPPGYAPGYPVHLHAPQMFSDENPNAYCSIM